MILETIPGVNQTTSTGKLLIIAVKSRVMAIAKDDGRTLWSTTLPGSLGAPFVTVIADSERVFAHGHGRLHCMDIISGDILWSNDLPGCGYGFATLAFPGGVSAPDAALIQAIFAAQAASDSAGSSSAAH